MGPDEMTSRVIYSSQIHLQLESNKIPFVDECFLSCRIFPNVCTEYDRYIPCEIHVLVNQNEDYGWSKNECCIPNGLSYSGSYLVSL